MKMQSHYFPRGDMYRLIPSFMKQVMPGDRTEVHIRGMLETDIVAALRVPAVVASYAFYCPHRLVFTQWPDFIADADTAIAVPTVNAATSPFAEIGEVGSFTLTSLYRRAVKAIYNDYFGDPKFGTHANYTDIALDTAQNSMLPLKSVNQLLSEIALDVDEPADNYTVAASSIELTEFRRRLKQNARGNNQRIGGEKYVDALRRFGVEVREELISRPVLIGRASEVIYPQEVFNTSEVGTGSRVGRYRAAIDFKTKRFFSMEHGYIAVFHALRPFLIRPIPPLDRQVASRHFYMEEMEKPFREIASTLIGTTTDVEPDPLLPASKIFDLGDMIGINTPTGTLGYASTAAVANLVYPTVNGTPKVELGLSCSAEIVR